MFKIAQGKASIETLKRDLKAANIPYTNEAGMQFDFHSFRKCFVTLLNANEVHERFRKILMRHENTSLTDSYDDATLHNLQERVQALPSFALPTEEELQSRKDKDERIKWVLEHGAD